MELTKITREFARTDELKRPDGTSVWLRFSASVEAALDPEDGKSLADLYTVLHEIVIAEVNTKMSEARAHFKKSAEKAQASNASPAPTSNLEERLQQLPRKL